MATLIDHLMLFFAFLMAGFAIGFLIAYTLGQAGKNRL
jgi:hypothetical protein